MFLPAMISSTVKPLSLSLQKFQPPTKTLKSTVVNSHSQSERGHQFDTGDTFFRHESATGRDLGVLSAALYKQSNGSLRVLDAMCGCGIRSLRYLRESDADFLWANDANENHRDVIVGNLSEESGEEIRWKVTHNDASRVLTECYMKKDYFDLVDVDSFGSDSSYFRAAICAVKLGGLLYITSTDGYSSGGHRPQHTLAAYGAYVRPLPYSNEIGLRILIGGAVREASVLGYHVLPLFSYYSYHGPVFRVMLQLKRGRPPSNCYYKFISYCIQCGNSQNVSWEKLGEIRCTCNTNVHSSNIVCGPLWTGPLHDATHLTSMLNLSEQWGWTGNDTGKNLEKLIKQMIEESDPRLPVGYIKLDEIAHRAKINSPPLGVTMSILLEEGYAASRSHIVPNAIKTNCPMVECIRIVQQIQHCSETR